MLNKILPLSLVVLFSSMAACAVEEGEPEAELPELDSTADLPQLEAYAKKKKDKGNTGQTDVTCAVLLPPELVLGETFSAKVVRVPRYPGSWFSPTITVEVDYPTAGNAEYFQDDERHIAKYGVTYAIFQFLAPTAQEAPDIIANGSKDAVVTAWVSEATTGAAREYSCEALVPVLE